MGRLEDIVERNRNPKRSSERLTVGIGLGVFLLLIIGLVVFTDLGMPPDAKAPPANAGSGEKRVRDIGLGAPGKPVR